jgi:hypothetical protein
MANNGEKQKKDSLPPLISAMRSKMDVEYKTGQVPFFIASLRAITSVTENAWLFLKLSFPWVLAAIIADLIFQNPYACQYKEVRSFFPCTSLHSVAFLNILGDVFFASGFACAWGKLVFRGDGTYLYFKMTKLTFKIFIYMLLFLIAFIAPFFVLFLLGHFDMVESWNIFLKMPIYMMAFIALIAPFFAVKYLMIIPAKILDISGFASKDSVRMTKKNILRIIAGFLVILFIYSMLVTINKDVIGNFLITYRFNAIILTSIFFKLIPYTMVAVLTSYLVEVYKFLDVENENE